MTQEIPEADPSDRLQLSHGKKIFKRSQDNQEPDYDKIIRNHLTGTV